MVIPTLFCHRTRPGRLREISARFCEAHLADRFAEVDFDDATFDRSAASFDNPDHVRIVIHNYRRRLGLAEGESKYDDLEKLLAEGKYCFLIFFRRDLIFTGTFERQNHRKKALARSRMQSRKSGSALSFKR